MKISGDRSCQKESVCTTRYPILLVHGAFFRDGGRFNYWGRIPDELEANGAKVFYGGQQSADSVENSAAELTSRIREIVAVNGCGKVNVIAHSKGGLDMRWAIAHSGAAPYVASLITIATPHRGCRFADHLLQRLAPPVISLIEKGYNCMMKWKGDPTPNFLAAVQDLTVQACEPRDRQMTMPEGIYCRSIGAQMKAAGDARFPLSLVYGLVEKYDGPCDGLVGTHSMKWGEDWKLIIPQGKRGVSHWDMTDLHRKDIPGFDVKRFYVQLVADLKARGL